MADAYLPDASKYERFKKTSPPVAPYLATNASHPCESTLTCIPYLRPPCLAAVQLKNFLSFSSLKFRQLPHTLCFTCCAMYHPFCKNRGLCSLFSKSIECKHYTIKFLLRPVFVSIQVRSFSNESNTDESRYPDTFIVILKTGFLDSVSRNGNCVSKHSLQIQFDNYIET